MFRRDNEKSYKTVIIFDSGFPKPLLDDLDVKRRVTWQKIVCRKIKFYLQKCKIQLKYTKTKTELSNTKADGPNQSIDTVYHNLSRHHN